MLTRSTLHHCGGNRPQELEAGTCERVGDRIVHDQITTYSMMVPTLLQQREVVIRKAGQNDAAAVNTTRLQHDAKA